MAIIPMTGPTAAPASGGPARQLVVFLHGVGADGADLIDLAPYFARLLPDAAFIAPDAPHPCDMGPWGRQWYSLQDRTPSVLLAGVEAVRPSLDAFLDEELAKHGLTEENLIVVGFSQGTITALHVLPRRARPCAAIIGFSGRLIAPELLDIQAVSRPPIMLIHGTGDEVVPSVETERAAQALAQAGFPVEAHMRPGLGHGIDGEGLTLAVGFAASQMGS